MRMEKIFFKLPLNYSEKINEELDKIYNMPLGEAIKAQVAEEAKEKSRLKKLTDLCMNISFYPIPQTPQFWR